MPLSFDPQVIQILSNAAQAFGRNVRERQRMAQQREQFDEQQKIAASNLKIKEENIKLQQEKLDLAKRKQTAIESARQERFGLQREKIEIRRAEAATKAFRALNPTVRKKATDVNKQIMDGVLTQPLESDRGNDLRAFQEMSVTKLAKEVNRLKRSLASVDEFDRMLHEQQIAGGDKGVAKILELERQLELSTEALNIRQEQVDNFQLSNSGKFTQDPEVQNALRSAFISEVGGALGLVTVPEAEPTTAGVPTFVTPEDENVPPPPDLKALEQAGAKPQATQEPAGVPLTPLAQVITDLDFDDNKSIELLAVEAARLSSSEAKNLLLTLQQKLSTEELATFMRATRKILRGK